MKKFIFAFILVTPMVAHADISSEIMCFESGGIESVNFEIKTYGKTPPRGMKGVGKQT